MTRSRLRLKTLCICALVLGLLSFNASAAQASGNWMVNGSNVTSTLKPSIGMTLGVLQDALSTKIAGALVVYDCTSGQLSGASLEAEGGLTNGFKAKFTGCQTLLNGSLSAVCAPKSSGLASGEIETVALKGSMQLGSGEPVVRIEPSSGSSFTVIRHSEECSLPESVPVSGQLVVDELWNEGDVELSVHWIEEETFTSELYVISNTAEHAAALNGSASVKLSGAHTGLKWSALPA